MWHATYLGKLLTRGITFVSDLASIGGLQKKLWASKMLGIPIARILPFFQNLDLGVPKKMTFECNPRGQPQRIL
jgi:hypothetical protein